MATIKDIVPITDTPICLLLPNDDRDQGRETEGGRGRPTCGKVTKTASVQR